MRGEIRIRLPLDDNATIETIVADRQALHPYFEIAALAHEFEQSSVPLRLINQQLMTHKVPAGSSRAFHIRAISGLDMWDRDDDGIVDDLLSNGRHEMRSRL